MFINHSVCPSILMWFECETPHRQREERAREGEWDEKTTEKSVFGMHAESQEIKIFFS